MSEQSTLDTILEQGGLIAVLLAAIAGFVGWRVGTAKDSVRVELHDQRLKSLEERIDRLRTADASNEKDVAAALASINTTLGSVADAIIKIERRLNKLEEREDG